MTYKFVTITGPDRVGKETQSKLLNYVLTPSTRVEFPDYTHWSGKIIRAILNNRQFLLDVDSVGGPTDTWIKATYDLVSRDRGCLHKQDKHPEIFQLLQWVNRHASQERLQTLLKEGHVIADRYDVDALGYGLIDGCSLDLLLSMKREAIESDVVVLLTGRGYERKGEVDDINERDDTFQNKVRAMYTALSTIYPDWIVINCDTYTDPTKYVNIADIHRHICYQVSGRIEQAIEPLDFMRVRKLVSEWEKDGKEKGKPA